MTTSDATATDEANAAAAAAEQPPAPETPAAEPAVRIRNLSKAYRMWSSPAARLRVPILESLAGAIPGKGGPSRWLRDKAHAQYHDFYALHDVSLEIQKGETIGIIGRNGSGKSTLLQLIAHILEPSGGSVEVNGRIAALLELGSGFNPDFTGRENVYLNAAILGLSREETAARFDDIAKFADIGEFIDQPIKTYSSGMVVRLAFAVNSMVEPDILIIDEALAVGDIFFQQKCYRFIKNEMKERTKIIVAHDLHAIQNLSDRVLVMSHGKVFFEGEPRQATALYTKLMQDETFAAPVGDTPSRVEGGNEAPQEKPPLPWRELAPDAISGRREVRFTHAALTDKDNRPLEVVDPEDRVRIHALVQVDKAPIDLIFGYIIHDRVGNYIAGDNHLPLRDGPTHCAETGTYHYTLYFTWPYLMPAEYTITIGIGEGDEPFSHTIQAWALNLFKVTATSTQYDVHCMVAHPIDHLTFEKWDG